jgi:hypothetical protein
VFYDKGSYSDGWRYLEAASNDAGYVAWGQVGDNGTTGIIGSGKRNTELILAALQQAGKSGAAQLCVQYSQRSYRDWFLPSENELQAMYTSLKRKGLGGFRDRFYLSSSPSWGNGTGEGYVSVVSFSSGRVEYGEKVREYWVRPIRQF